MNLIKLDLFLLALGQAAAWSYNFYTGNKENSMQIHTAAFIVASVIASAIVIPTILSSSKNKEK